MQIVAAWNMLSMSSCVDMCSTPFDTSNERMKVGIDKRRIGRGSKTKLRGGREILIAQMPALPHLAARLEVPRLEVLAWRCLA